jgi:galactokinase/mevalonate kinase-like predicted kinase
VAGSFQGSALFRWERTKRLETAITENDVSVIYVTRRETGRTAAQLSEVQLHGEKYL